MLAVAIVVFREVLEAGLIVGIVMAAPFGIPDRNRWIATGVAGGAAAGIGQSDVGDISFILADDSLPGRIMHTLVGYVARPEGVQLLVFAATLAAMGSPMWLISRGRRRSRGQHAAART